MNTNPEIEEIFEFFRENDYLLEEMIDRINSEIEIAGSLQMSEYSVEELEEFLDLVSETMTLLVDDVCDVVESVQFFVFVHE